MNSYYVELTFELGAPADREEFQSHLDDVAEAFAALDDVDGDVGADLATGRVDLCMTLTSVNHAEAVAKAVAAARTAVQVTDADDCEVGAEAATQAKVWRETLEWLATR